MKIEYDLKAGTELGALPRNAQSRIIHKMKFYAEQPNPLIFAKRLQGNNLYRFRAGDYKMLFKVEDQTIKIITIKKRDDVYKHLDLN